MTDQEFVSKMIGYIETAKFDTPIGLNRKDFVRLAQIAKDQYKKGETK